MSVQWGKDGKWGAMSEAEHDQAAAELEDWRRWWKWKRGCLVAWYRRTLDSVSQWLIERPRLTTTMVSLGMAVVMVAVATVIVWGVARAVDMGQ